jgi:DNA-binding MarR family transcriptional regulator
MDAGKKIYFFRGVSTGFLRSPGPFTRLHLQLFGVTTAPTLLHKNRLTAMNTAQLDAADAALQYDDRLLPLKVGSPIDLGDLPHLLGYNLRRAQLEMWRHFSQNVDQGEVRPSVYSLFLLVGANPGIAQIELANYLRVDKARIVTLIDRLEAPGWVIRRRARDDRRRQGIFLTPAGRQKLAQLKQEVDSHDACFKELFTEDELQLLLTMLQRIYTTAEARATAA